METRYDHTRFEEKMYQSWEKSGGFAPQAGKKQTFTIIMPPPNANDPLHIGHAMFVTIEDILTRYHRMLDEATLWLPGTDHAGIETQFVFEKKLKKQGKSRFDFDRETLYKKIWNYVRESSDHARDQLKRLGASADWTRFHFTLDTDIVSVVLDTFKKLHTAKLVYRDVRLVNYCTRCGTGFSQLEVKHQTRKSPFLYMKYGPFVIGTVRPETKFRDTALAVHPKDKRYKKHIGKTFEIQGLLGPVTMKIIADTLVDPAFGTGIMKVTPAHDFHDFELGKKYNLPVTPIIGRDGKMDFSWFLAQKNTPEKYRRRAEAYHNSHVATVRKMMRDDLKEDGLLERVDEDYQHTANICYRCNSVLEPLPLPQFFIRVAPLVTPVLQALRNKQVTIHGAGGDKTMQHWLKNLQDWNISRQIVWGIRMSVWYEINFKSQMANGKSDIEVIFINKNKEKIQGKLPQLLRQHTLEEIKSGLQQLHAPIDAEYVIANKPPGKNYIQETDTFDTWFSSGQWPFATLKASHNKKDYKRFYPTQVMETGYDILIFWVMRMLLLGMFATGKLPFRHVYLHGLVRDEQGRKMSKSRGNVINPLAVIDKYGADALRMALVMSTTAGQDSSTGEGKIRGMRNFTNKIWNATRFIVMNRELKAQRSLRQPFDFPSTYPRTSAQDKRSGQTKLKANTDTDFYKKLNTVAKNVSRQLDDLKVGLAAETVYAEFWHWYCDTCIEQGKRGEISHTALVAGLATFLKLLHPFVPFVTEACWEVLQKAELVDEKKLLMNSKWPLHHNL